MIHWIRVWSHILPDADLYKHMQHWYSKTILAEQQSSTSCVFAYHAQKHSKHIGNKKTTT